MLSRMLAARKAYMWFSKYSEPMTVELALN